MIPAVWSRAVAARLAVIYLLVAGSTGAFAVRHMNAAAAETRRAYDMLRVDSPGSTLQIAARKVAGWVGHTLDRLGLGDDGGPRLSEVEIALREASESRKMAIAASAFTALLSVVYVAAAHLVSGNQRASVQAVSVVSLLWLSIGLVAPALSMTAHGSVPILGDVVLRHDTRSVVGAAWALLITAQWPVGVLLALCGVIAPIVKLLALFWSTADSRPSLAAISGRLGSALAPWAMADVFTLALLIIFFSARHGASVQASLEPGAYFFAGHCVLAIVVARFVGKLGAARSSRPAGS